MDPILCHLLYARYILWRFFPGNAFNFCFMPISHCTPINGIKYEFMPDRHKNGRPTLSRFDMKSDRYCVEPVCVWGLFVPRDQFDMRACREWSTNAALEVVSHAMCSRTTASARRQSKRQAHLTTHNICAASSAAHWRLKRRVVAWKTRLFTLKRPGWLGSELMPVAKRANCRTSAVSLTFEVRHGRVRLLCSE